MFRIYRRHPCGGPLVLDPVVVDVEISLALPVSAVGHDPNVVIGQYLYQVNV
jgi:hypothetical protein